MKDLSIEARSERLLIPTRAQLKQFEQEPNVPVLAGPWLGEVGFELLYWLPFLRWAVSEFPGLRNQLVILSRGGVETWYEGIVSRYLDLFDYFSLQEFRARFPKFVKQTATYDDYKRRKYVESELVELVRLEVGSQRLNVLHPSVMYRAFKFLHYTNERGIAVYFPKLTPPAVAVLEGRLPKRFVAARFYKSYPLPMTDANQAFAQSLVTRIAEAIPVVLLNTGIPIDRKHPDFPLDVSGNVSTVEGCMTPANNLTVQSAIVSKATAFVGGYGLSYLAPYYGRPSFALYSDPNSIAKTGHLELAETALGKPNLGGYWVGSVEEMTPEAVADMVLAS